MCLDPIWSMDKNKGRGGQHRNPKMFACEKAGYFTMIYPYILLSKKWKVTVQIIR